MSLKERREDKKITPKPSLYKRTSWFVVCIRDHCGCHQRRCSASVTDRRKDWIGLDGAVSGPTQWWPLRLTSCEGGLSCPHAIVAWKKSSLGGCTDSPPRGDVFMCRSMHRDGSQTYIRYITLEDIEELFDSLLILKIIGMQHFWHLDGLWHRNQRVEQASYNNMTWLSCINGCCCYVHDRRTKVKPSSEDIVSKRCSIAYFTCNYC